MTSCGRMAGSTTLRTSRRRSRPKLRAAFLCTGSTSCTARITVTSSEKKEAMKISQMAARSPTPNQRMAIGIQASGEIGRSTCTSGFHAASARRERPSAMPAGMASAAASRNPQVTRNSEATR